MTSFRAGMCLLGVPKTKFHISSLDPIFPKNHKFWPIFEVTANFVSKRPKEWRCLQALTTFFIFPTAHSSVFYVMLFVQYSAGHDSV